MMAIEGWDYKNIDDLAMLDQENLGGVLNEIFLSTTSILVLYQRAN